MQFDQIIMRAWQVIWKHKILWVFGILAGCGGQGLSNTYRGSSNWRTDGGEGQSQLEFFQQWADQIEQFLSQNYQMVIMTVLVLIVLGLLISLVRLLSILLFLEAQIAKTCLSEEEMNFSAAPPMVQDG